MSKYPVAAPSKEAISAAVEAFQQWELHYYQLLWFHNPVFTKPGQWAAPFKVRQSKEHIRCIQVEFPANQDYNFLVTPDMLDAEFMAKCELIWSSHNEQRVKKQNLYCCPLATGRNCVCVCSFECPIHGVRCIGSHD
jgi:hypothetical protein